MLTSPVASLRSAVTFAVPETVQVFLMQRELTLVIAPAALVRAVLLITAVTTAASLFPSLRAALNMWLRLVRVADETATLTRSSGRSAR